MNTQKEIKWKQGLLVQISETNVINNKYVHKRNWYIISNKVLVSTDNSNRTSLADFYYDTKTKEYIYRYNKPLHSKKIVDTMETIESIKSNNNFKFKGEGKSIFDLEERFKKEIEQEKE